MYVLDMSIDIFYTLQTAAYSMQTNCIQWKTKLSIRNVWIMYDKPIE